ncbi:MAG: hypothetical protein ACXQTG_00490 [Methanoculleaceae archaeon]
MAGLHLSQANPEQKTGTENWIIVPHHMTHRLLFPDGRMEVPVKKRKHAGGGSEGVNRLTLMDRGGTSEQGGLPLITHVANPLLPFTSPPWTGDMPDR